MAKLEPKTLAKFKVMLEKQKAHKRAVASKIRSRVGASLPPKK